MKNVRFNLFDKKNFNRLKLIDSIFASLTVKIFVVSIYNFIFSFFLSIICSFQFFFYVYLCHQWTWKFISILLFCTHIKHISIQLFQIAIYYLKQSNFFLLRKKRKITMFICYIYLLRRRFHLIRNIFFQIFFPIYSIQRVWKYAFNSIW